MARTGGTMASPETVAAQVAKQGKLAPAYLVYGAELFRADQVIFAVRAKTLEGSPPGFNHDHVSAASTSGNQIVNLCRTLPMMAPRRLVEVLDADRIDDRSSTALLTYLEDPVPETVLLLRALKFDARTKLMRGLKKQAVVVKCAAMSPREIPRWIREHARLRGIELATGVADLMTEVVGTDLGVLDTTLEKLSLYIAPRDEVSLEDVDVAIAHTRSVAAFELADAVLDRDVLGALRCLQRLLGASKGRDAEFQSLGMVAWQVRRLLRARDLLAGSVRSDEICRQLRVPPGLSRRFLSRVRSARGRDLLRAHDALFRTDKAMKSSGKLGGRAALESLIVQLCVSETGHAG